MVAALSLTVLLGSLGMAIGGGQLRSGAPACNSLVSSSVEFAYSSAAGTGASVFNSNYTSLSAGPPIGGHGAMVVQ